MRLSDISNDSFPVLSNIQSPHQIWDVDAYQETVSPEEIFPLEARINPQLSYFDNTINQDELSCTPSTASRSIFSTEFATPMATDDAVHDDIHSVFSYIPDKAYNGNVSDAQVVTSKSLNDIKAYSNVSDDMTCFNHSSSSKNAKRTKSMPVLLANNNGHLIDELNYPNAVGPPSCANLSQIDLFSVSSQKNENDLFSDIGLGPFHKPVDINAEHVQMQKLDFNKQNELIYIQKSALNTLFSTSPAPFLSYFPFASSPVSSVPSTPTVASTPNHSRSSSTLFVGGEPLKFVDFFQKTVIDAKRYRKIIKLAETRGLDIPQLKNALCLFTNNTIDNNGILQMNNNTNFESFNVGLKLGVICSLIEIQNPASSALLDRKNPEDYKKFLAKIPLIDTSQGLMIQIRSSCGKEFISNDIDKVNETILDNMLQELLAQGFDLRLLEHLNLFECFKTLMGDEAATKKDSMYIKRPLNTYMLYRSSMIKVAVALTMLNVVEELTDYYLNHFVRPYLNENSSHDVDEKIILELIQKDVEFLLDPHKAFADQQKILSILRDFKLQKHYFAQEHINVRLDKLSQYHILPTFKHVKVHHGAMCHVIALLWHTEEEHIKSQFAEYSKIEKLLHEETYPHYKFSPKKRKNASPDKKTLVKKESKEVIVKPKSKPIKKPKMSFKLASKQKKIL